MDTQSSLMLKETVQEYINQEQKGIRFPISLNDTYQAIGYTRKDNAVRAILNAGMIEGQDLLRVEEMLESGKTSIDYMMTIDCFKHFCMVAKTEIGYQVRQYFIDVEKAYRKFLVLNTLTGVIDQVNETQQEYGQIISQIMTKIETNPDAISQKDLDAALIANRLGLAYNKRLKAFQMILNKDKPQIKSSSEKSPQILVCYVNDVPICYRVTHKKEIIYDAKTLSVALEIPLEDIQEDLKIDERSYITQESFKRLLSNHQAKITG